MQTFVWEEFGENNFIMCCSFSFPAEWGSAGINQDVRSVDDEKIWVPAGQRRSRSVRPRARGSCVPLPCAALHTCTGGRGGATPWASLLYQGRCSRQQEVRLAVPDFPLGWASCTMPHRQRNTESDLSTLTLPRLGELCISGRALHLAVSSFSMCWVILCYARCIVIHYYIPFCIAASKKHTSYLNIIHSLEATDSLKWL